METSLKVGDIVRCKSDYKYRGSIDYGVVLAVGGYKGCCEDTPDAVWCVWKSSKKEAVHAYEKLTEEEKAQQASWTSATIRLIE